jgi:hypothetical protein
MLHLWRQWKFRPICVLTTSQYNRKLLPEQLETEEDVSRIHGVLGADQAVRETCPDVRPGVNVVARVSHVAAEPLPSYQRSAFNAM